MGFDVHAPPDDPHEEWVAEVVCDESELEVATRFEPNVFGWRPA